MLWLERPSNETLNQTISLVDADSNNIANNVDVISSDGCRIARAREMDVWRQGLKPQ